MCGAKWKNCGCDDWGELGLQREANELWDQGGEPWLLQARDDVEQMDPDGLIDWENFDPGHVAEGEEEEEILRIAGGRVVVLEDPEYVDELVGPGNIFETQEDLTRFLRENPDCGHSVWQAVLIGEHGRREDCVLCDLCARHQHPYLLQCRACRLRVCVGCGRQRFRLR